MKLTNDTTTDLEPFLTMQPIGTRRTYQYQLMRFERFLQASGGRLDALTRADVQQYIQELQTAKKAAATITTTYYSICAWCRHTDQLHATQDVRVPGRQHISRQLVKSLDRNERNRLLRDVERVGDVRDTAIVYTLLHAGLRIAELVNLDVSDLTLGERSGSIRILGKGNKERIVPLSAEARHWIRRYLDGRSVGPLFLSNRKTRIHPNTIQKMLAKHGTHPHALRHTFCRALVDAGVDLATVATLAGHEDINVTRRYAQPSPNELSAAIDRAYT